MPVGGSGRAAKVSPTAIKHRHEADNVAFGARQTLVQGIVRAGIENEIFEMRVVLALQTIDRLG